MPTLVPFPPDRPLQLRQVYVRYQGVPHRSTTFEIDDSALTENGFTYCDVYPMNFTGNTLTLTSTDPLCIKAYSDNLTNHRFVVGFGRSFDKEWIHVTSDESEIIPWWNYAQHKYKTCWSKRQSMHNARLRRVLGLNGSALCKPVPLKQPGFFRFRPSYGGAQECVGLSLRYFTIPVSMTCQVNGQPSMLSWVAFCSSHWH